MRRSLTFGPIQSSVPPKEFFFALVFTFAALAIPVSAQTVAFTNVNVIPMDRERVVANQTVVIKNGLIVEIGDAKKVKLAKDAVRIDGTGKYLLPGLVDMHTHLLSDSDEFPDSIGPDELRVMVANGVTTVRFMIGTPKNTKTTNPTHGSGWIPSDPFYSQLRVNGILPDTLEIVIGVPPAPMRARTLDDFSSLSRMTLRTSR
jgi:hypothetical protein